MYNLRLGRNFLSLIAVGSVCAATVALLTAGCVWYTVLWRQIALPGPAELYSLSFFADSKLTELPVRGQIVINAEGSGVTYDVFSLGFITSANEYAKGDPVFAGFSEVRDLTVTAEGQVIPIKVGYLVTNDFFKTLQCSPCLGRLSNQSAPLDERSVVISKALWIRAFGASDSIPGRVVQINGIAYQIQGVAPDGASEIYDPVNPPELFITIGNAAPLDQRSRQAATDPDHLWWLKCIARSGGGGLEAQIAAAGSASFLNSISRTLRINGVNALPRWPSLSARSAYTGMRPRSATQIRAVNVCLVLSAALAGAALVGLALVLTIKAAAKRADYCTQYALGARKHSIFKSVIYEASVLVSMGLILGTALSVLLLSQNQSIFSVWGHLSPAMLFSPSIIFCILLAGLLATIFVSIFPLSVIPNEQSAISTVMRNSGGNTYSRGTKLIILLSVMLAVAGCVFFALLARQCGTYVAAKQNLRRGFQSDGIITFTVGTESAELKYGSGPALFSRLADIFATRSGKLVVGYSEYPLLTSGGVSIPIHTPTSAQQGPTPTSVNSVSPKYFTGINAKLIGGRDIDVSDRAGVAQVAIVNRSFAIAAYGTTEVVGKHFGYSPDASERFQIVGVVDDLIKVGGSEGKAQPTVYFSINQRPATSSTFVLKVIQGAEVSESEIRRSVWNANSRLSISQVTTIEHEIRALFRDIWFIASVGRLFMGVTGWIALVAVISGSSLFFTTKRKEMAIRLALGSPRSSIFFLFARQVLLASTIGALVGLFCSESMARMLPAVFGIERSVSGVAQLLIIAGVPIITITASLPPMIKVLLEDPLRDLKSL